MDLHPATASKQNCPSLNPNPQLSIAITWNTPFSTVPTGTHKMSSKETSKSKDKEKSKVHKLSLKGSARLVAEFVRLHSFWVPFRLREGLLTVYSSNTLFTAFCTRNSPIDRFRFTDSFISFQRGVYPAEDFTVYVLPTMNLASNRSN